MYKCGLLGRKIYVRVSRVQEAKKVRVGVAFAGFQVQGEKLRLSYVLWFCASDAVGS